MDPADYDRIAPSWDEHRRDFRPRERAVFEQLVDSLPAGGRVLDLGCGTGIPNARFITEAGHRVTGIDASRDLLALAAKNLPDAELSHGRVEDAPLGGPFDAVVCWDVLFHLPRERHEPIIQRIASCLVPQGTLLLTSGGSENPPFTDTMFGHRFFYDAHAPQQAVDMVRRAGFTITCEELINPPTGGRDKGRLVISARKT